MNLISKFAVLVLILFTSTLAISEEWLSKENALVKSYLLKLKNKDIGKKQKGVELPYNMNPIKDSIYLGKYTDKTNGLHVYKFQDEKRKFVLIWKETEGKFELPNCEVLVGAGSFVVSGDVYTSVYLTKDDGVIENHCQAAVWFQ